MRRGTGVSEGGGFGRWIWREGQCRRTAPHCAGHRPTTQESPRLLDGAERCWVRDVCRSSNRETVEVQGRRQGPRWQGEKERARRGRLQSPAISRLRDVVGAGAVAVRIVSHGGERSQVKPGRSALRDSSLISTRQTAGHTVLDTCQVGTACSPIHLVTGLHPI